MKHYTFTHRLLTLYITAANEESAIQQAIVRATENLIRERNIGRSDFWAKEMARQNAIGLIRDAQITESMARNEPPPANIIFL